MRDNELFAAANPFRVPLQPVTSPHKTAFFSALKFCVVIACALAITLVIASQNRRYLLYRLTNNFDSLATEAQSLRLLEIAALDDLSSPFLVSQLAHTNEAVARDSFELIGENLNRWSSLDDNACRLRHATIVESIDRISHTLPVDRTLFATSLLRQTIMEFVQHQDDDSRRLHTLACDVLGRLSLSNSNPLDGSVSPQRLVVRSHPLAVEPQATLDSWTDWPPRETVPEQEEYLSPAPVGTAPLIYRSGAKDTSTLSVAEPSSVTLLPVGDARRILVAETKTNIQAVALAIEDEQAGREIEDPLSTYNIRSVIYWLASDDAELRRQAELELLRRGLDATQVSIAKQFSLGDVASRLETIERIVHDPNVDPRPWLLWLLEDEHREVQLRVVNILATIPDPAVRQKLRDQLNTTRDTVVAARIRRVLDLR